MSKRANGEGNIRKRPDGTWEARYVFDGKRYSVYGKTQAEVRKKLTEAQAQIDGGAYIAPSKITVAEWLDKWQAECLSNLKQSTRTRYEKDIRLYIVPAIGKVKLNALKPDMIRAMNRKEFERGLSEKSIANYNGTLHAALQQAVDDKLIQTNVCDNVKPPRANKPKAEMHPLKDNQVGQFIRAIRGNIYEALFYTALFTGMRDGGYRFIMGLHRFSKWNGSSIQTVEAGGKKGRGIPFHNVKEQARTYIQTSDGSNIHSEKCKASASRTAIKVR